MITILTPDFFPVRFLYSWKDRRGHANIWKLSTVLEGGMTLLDRPCPASEKDAAPCVPSLLEPDIASAESERWRILPSRRVNLLQSLAQNGQKRKVEGHLLAYLRVKRRL